MTYHKMHKSILSGEIKMWQACFIQHTIDLLYSDDIKIRKNAKSFIFGNDPLFADICSLISYDIYTIRKNILKLYRQQKKLASGKKINGKYSKKFNEKIITKLAKDLLYA